MNPSPNSGNPCLVRRVVIGRPLQFNRLRRTVFKSEHIVSERAQATRKERRSSQFRKDFRGSAAKCAVAGKITWKGGGYEIRSLIRCPVVSVDPSNSAVLACRNRRRSRP